MTAQIINYSEILKKQYSKVHDEAREREDRIEIYKRFYGELQEIQNEDNLGDGVVRKKIDELEKTLQEIILYESSQMERNIREKEKLGKNLDDFLKRNEGVR